MHIVIGADHAGFDLKEVLAAYLRHCGHEVIDIGTHSDDPVDYPDYADALSQALLDGRAERGVRRGLAGAVATLDGVLVRPVGSRSRGSARPGASLARTQAAAHAAIRKTEDAASGVIWPVIQSTRCFTPSRLGSVAKPAIRGVHET